MYGVPNPPVRYPRTGLKRNVRRSLKRHSGKKASGEKHKVCLYLSRDMHPISPVFINLIFETVNGSCVDRIKRKAVPVIYNTAVEKMLTYCCFEVWFFQLEIMSSSYQLIYQLQINVPTMGRIQSILYKPWSYLHAFDGISYSVFQFL